MHPTPTSACDSPAPAGAPSGRLAGVLLALACCLGPAAPAGAQVLTVDRPDDAPLGASPTCTAAPLDCSLRQAIELANQQGPTTILVPAGEYELSIAGDDENLNQTGDLDYFGTGDLVIQGDGPDLTVIEQVQLDRIFHLHPSAHSVRLEGLTLRFGRGVFSGGAVVSNNRRLEMVDVVARDNEATNLGGCVFRLRVTNDEGALFERVTFTGCTAGNAGGALYLETSGDVGDSAILGCRFAGNEATGVGGGAYLSFMDFLTIEDTVFSGNASLGQQPTDPLGSGGGAYFINVGAIVRRGAFVDNRAGTFETDGAEGGAVAVIGGVGGAVVDFENVTFARNQVEGETEFGGALHVLDSQVDLVHVTVTDSLALGQTAIHVDGAGSVDLANSVIDGGCEISGGTVTSSDFNVERPWSGTASSTCNLGPGDLLVADLALRPPAVNGGSFAVPTQALLPGSAAGGLVSSTACGDEDARGAPRTGLFCDAGAHETGAVAPGSWIFADGLESGDTMAWSASTP